MTTRNAHQSSAESVGIGRLFRKGEVADDQYRRSGEDCHDRTQQGPDPTTGRGQSQFEQPQDREQIRTAGPTAQQLQRPRTYRTCEDPFAADWPELESMLEQAPELDAKTLFEWVCERRPGVYQEGQLRTLQRHVSTWRALHSEKMVALEQCHRPGEALQTDGTWMNTLGTTVGGQAFPHVLIHSVLPYSNWEWGRVAQSESLLAIRLGLQSTLAQLGHVPAVHQTDISTTATHEMEK